MELRRPAKILLSLLGSAVLALIVALILAGISVSGVTSMSAAIVLLWIAFALFSLTLLAAGILLCPNSLWGELGFYRRSFSCPDPWWMVG